MAVVGKSNCKLRIEECDFIELILSKILHLVVFNCMDCYLATKYKAENLLLNKLFSNLKLGKSGRILLCKIQNLNK